MITRQKHLPSIYYGPNNINYFSSNMAAEFSRRGYSARWQLFYNDLGQEDLSTCVFLDERAKKGNFHKWSFLLRNFLTLLNQVDVFHFTGFQSLLPLNMDIPLLHTLGKKVCMTYMGTELRVDSSDAVCDQQISSLGGNSNKELSMRRSRRYLRFTPWIDAQIIVDATLFPSPKLYPEYFPQETEFFYLPPAIDVYKLPYTPKKPGDPIVITHIPSRGKYKGTEFVKPVFERLSVEFPNVRTVLLTGLSHPELIREFLQADIVVEQLLANMYGNTAREAMALGRVVVGRINPEPHERIRKMYPMYDTPVPPIVPARPETLYEVLVDLIQHPERFNALGLAGRQFVEKYHSVPVVADRLEAIYQKIWHA